MFSEFGVGSSAFDRRRKLLGLHLYSPRLNLHPRSLFFKYEKLLALASHGFSYTAKYKTLVEKGKGFHRTLLGAIHLGVFGPMKRL
jgi:hypothetical protein